MRLRLLLRGALGVAVAAALLALLVGYAGGLWRALDVAAYFRAHLGVALAGAALLGAVLGARRTALAAVIGATIAAATLGPVWRAAAWPTTDAGAACEAPRLRVATANVLLSNTRHADAVAALTALDVDVLATQETSDAFWRLAAPLRAKFPHHVARQRTPSGVWSVVLWSTRPIRDADESAMNATTPIFARGVIDVEDGSGGVRPVGLLGLHVALPLIGAHVGQIEGIGRLAEPLPPDRILLGDFNATPWSYSMARAEALSNARMPGGLRRTWLGHYRAVLGAPIPPAVFGHQIDHILVSPGWRAETIETVVIPGSDHWAVRAELIGPC